MDFNPLHFSDLILNKVIIYDYITYGNFGTPYLMSSYSTKLHLIFFVIKWFRKNWFLYTWYVILHKLDKFYKYQVKICV